MERLFKPDFAGKRIWMYWPGEKAYQFKENVEKGFMACGLPEDREVGDLDVIMNIRGGLDAALNALKGLVFYEGFRKEIMELYHAGVTKIGMNLLNNALRSEHIPYNLFFPKLGINVLDASSALPVTFIFSEQNVTNLQVTDILEDSSYEIIRPVLD